MKHAVYSGTRNLYKDMETAAKSLAANSSVDVIHFLIEDDVFPYELPEFVHCLNVSKQKFFHKYGVNMNTPFTYMAMLRVCYTKLLPNVDKVLQLDVDTVCVDDIDAIWKTEMGDTCVAMVEEKLGTYKPYGPLYYNAGVVLFDLEKMRNNGLDEKLITFLNTEKVPYVDQDALCRLAGRITGLDIRYNECFVTGYTDSPAIVHYAGFRDWQTSIRVPRREHLKKYRNMTWEEVIALRESKDTDSGSNI